MKHTNRSWRAQKGSVVQFIDNRRSLTGTVARVLQPPRIGLGDGSGIYLVRDQSGGDHIVTGQQMRFADKTTSATGYGEPVR